MIYHNSYNQFLLHSWPVVFSFLPYSSAAYTIYSVTSFWVHTLITKMWDSINLVHCIYKHRFIAGRSLDLIEIVFLVDFLFLFSIYLLHIGSCILILMLYGILYMLICIWNLIKMHPWFLFLISSLSSLPVI